jgi:hypothetical protein
MMRALRFVDDVLAERAHVVGAEKPESRSIRKREVRERLVPMALGELRVAAARPDRLADPTDRVPAGAVLLGERLPGRDDASGIGTYLGHVGEDDRD